MSTWIFSIEAKNIKFSKSHKEYKYAVKPNDVFYFWLVGFKRVCLSTVYCSPEAFPNTFRSTLKRLSNFPVHSFIFPSTFWAFPTFSGSLFHLSLYFLGPSPHFPVHSFIFPSILLAPPHIFGPLLRL